MIVRLALALAVAAACGGDDPAPEPPPACASDLATQVAELLAAAPGADSQGYAVPAPAARQQLADSLAAEQPRATDDYDVCSTDDGQVVVWRPRGGAGQALIAVRAEPSRQVIVEAPHPLYDSTTGTEAVAVFDQTAARALVVAGNHRCADSGTPSGCDGTTSVCGSSAPYPVSDMAHATDSYFQAAHVALADRYPTDWIVSLHGMAGDGVHVSDGTTGATTSGAPVAQLVIALTGGLQGHDIRSCNAFTGATTTSSLCGTTNVQGRYVNGSADACTAAAAQADGRFLHLEQSLAVRGLSGRVADAIGAVAP